MLILNLLLFLFAFVFIWFGSGLIVSSVSRFSSKLRLSSFAVSFLLLGLLTSTPEFSVGIQSVASGNPGIFVGNLLGGIIVIFLFIIPLLAILGKGISLRNELDNPTLATALLVILMPSVVILDGVVTSIEGLMLIFLYIVLIVLVQRKNGLFDRSNSKLLDTKAYSHKDILKILAGIALVFLASSIIVDKTIYFANLLSIPEFYIGLLVISIGTDLPEISLVIRSVVSGAKDVAMGDYLGAGAASTLMFGIFTVLNNGEVLTIQNFLVTFIFMATALGAFYFLSFKRKFVSRTSGFVLISVYALFIIVELAR